MCLRVNKSVKAKKVNSSGYCVGWKVLGRDNLAIYQTYKYKIGNNFSSRTAKEISLYEESHGIEQGFHILLRREDARHVAKSSSNSYKIIKVYYNPKDVVAYGFWEFSILLTKKLHCVVTTEMAIKSLNHCR